MKKENIVPILLTIISLAATFAAGFYTNHLLNPPELDFPILAQARRMMENHAWYPVPSQTDQEYGMIKGLVDSYDDPYASFVEPIQHELQSDTFEGSFGGIGAQISINENGETALYPYPDSPAKLAGVQDGDIVRRVDETIIDAETALDTTVSLLRGPVGEKVSLVVLRPSDGNTYEFKIKRDQFPIPSVSWRILEQDARVGLIQVNLVAASTPDEILIATEELTAAGAEYFILDLRDNFGGLLEAGIDSARLFLEEGLIITQQLAGRGTDPYQVLTKGELAEIPLAVLINHNTASAAEILAGALQNQGRAILIGTPSYGKNTIQMVFNLDDGSSIHVTAGKWWFPEERDLEDFFLTPEIEISPDSYSDAECLRLAVEALLNSE
jgi:carboxyl-terminal processing protease